MEKSDFFSEMNAALRALPPEVHELTWLVMIVLYGHLIYGAFLERKKLKPHVRWYLKIRAFIMMFYLCVKAVDVKYGMFDLFLPIYILFYVDGLIIVKGYMFHRCENFFLAMKRLTSFNSKKINVTPAPNNNEKE
ncbi:hypothetical protein [Aequorivita echinoideorum]|uniref:Toxin secretion/phage lysis holin n=1 Tax=Aequorivita echinoideorum TaxID=1549647 RepID=A0ABS5S5K6_9FLAO|nr:hypothetical protein [Aequorivita echinoideorum]MBT0607647.1 hypothetical protein [Aequorivita echinoideorum]